MRGQMSSGAAERLRTQAAIMAACVLLASVMAGCATCSRMSKSLDSEMANGLTRRVNLYDNTGKLVRSWEGRIDLAESDSGDTWFDLDGKRVVIRGGILVVEEV